MALATHTRQVEQQTRRRSNLTLLGMIEQCLAKRAAHVAAIAAIDGELGRVFDRLAADRPVDTPPVPARPGAPVVAPPVQARPVATAAVPAPVLQPRSIQVKAARQRVSTAPGKWPKGPTVDDDVIRALTEGLTRPKEIRRRLDWGEGTIKAAFMRLCAAKRIVKSGATWSTAYRLAERATPAPTPRPHSVRTPEGLELEPVWSPHRDAPSLLGDRQTRAQL